MVMVMVMVTMADFYISLATALEHLRLEMASSVAVRDGVLSPSPPSIFPRKYNSMWILEVGTLAMFIVDSAVPSRAVLLI